ncbi:peptidase C14, caspase catalytic subunit p20 [Nitrobacter hamburgensis X14]|uniref:Peptidase C14, caspase catalytic subunit p20 n=1 Tax=Nitrobacter hamburgensis (strain DSM 10229 / NCIMB 13809 / X14) TaxID=323097 RepID=Q1QPN4_NITHX|nr:caspase domain-containing protein [Nitrobacter hamburgensis]ABE61813.1 peptidase C14, caspase catalytic subunit p20 [Nitrobacter hamburgensis X14]
MRVLACIALALIALTSLSPTNAQQAEKRVALVIGNAAYQSEALPTTANDAGLIAQTLQAAGFDVVGARDLDQDTLRRTFREFLDKVSASGPDTVAFIYLGGYGVQLEGENYFVPVDAKLARDTDVPLETLRLSDYIRPLAALKIKAGIVVLDAARANPFSGSDQPLASGLALVEPEPHMLIAFNAAPGTAAPQEKGPYGAYAQALAEMIRTGGLPLADVFDRTRLRVNEMTKGGEVPWSASKIEAPFMFFDRAPDAPPPTASNEQIATMRARPIRDLDAQDAYVAALERDTLRGYLDFLAAYPNDPMARRVRAIVAARREAITWRYTRSVDTPQAYWSYLRRYPRGPHVADAHRRLAYLAAAFEPPPTFTAISYDVPPPPEDEIVYFRQPVLVFDDPDYGFAPPPPPPVFFLPPPPPDFVVLAPPPPVFAAFVLPVPDYVPMPAYYSPPPYVAPPPQNVIYNNIHNTVVINTTTNMVTITRPGGQPQTVTPAQALASQPVSATPAATPSATQQPAAQQPAAPASGAPTTPTAPGIAATPPHGVSPGVAAAGAAVAGAALLAPALPKTVAKKAAMIRPQNPSAPAQQSKSPAQAGQPGAAQSGQPNAGRGQTAPASLDHKLTSPPLPGGPGGQPLPSANGKLPIKGQPQHSLHAPSGGKAAVRPLPSPSGQPGSPVQSPKRDTGAEPVASPPQTSPSPDHKPAAQRLHGAPSLPSVNGKPPVPGQPHRPQTQQETLSPPVASPAQSGRKTVVRPPTSPHGQSDRQVSPAHPARQKPVASQPRTRAASPHIARPTPPPAVRSAPRPVSRPAPPPRMRPSPPPQMARPPVARPTPPHVTRPTPPPKAHPTPQATKPCVHGQPCKR